MTARTMLAERRRSSGKRTRHRGKLCSGCKFNRRRVRHVRSRSAERMAWSREFRLYSRDMRAPMYWRAVA